eukprot:Protomagalhaensia_wolfi_Nauph_80__1314@NODE_1786_length_1339_cov_85_383846_g1391_i0_p1_GENE_NODE_1786_length_1339_cov_85_383846_g1391_i0NODE_1786_length_1339_cov_85_383846_g1391_i0_p1_ORF_typecomplete_len158_score15_47_NODE_1786_length_1339_cov_85_383846_g1391_i08101283
MYLSKPPLEAPHLAKILSEKAMSHNYNNHCQTRMTRLKPSKTYDPPPAHIQHELQAARDAATPSIAAQSVCQSLNSIHIVSTVFIPSMITDRMMRADVSTSKCCIGSKQLSPYVRHRWCYLLFVCYCPREHSQRQSQFHFPILNFVFLCIMWLHMRR